jgi:hypothetical protein
MTAMILLVLMGSSRLCMFRSAPGSSVASYSVCTSYEATATVQEVSRVGTQNSELRSELRTACGTSGACCVRLSVTGTTRIRANRSGYVLR